MEKKKKNILLVDDDKSLLQIFKLILQKEGYNTDTAETAQEALEKSKNGFYNLALIDVKLPDIDGIELLTQLHTTKPNMIKIMITGFPSTDNRVEALNRGADAYLVKPVKPEELLKMMKDKLKEQKAEK